jgi:acyl-CoA thioesterase-1
MTDRSTSTRRGLVHFCQLSLLGAAFVSTACGGSSPAAPTPTPVAPPVVVVPPDPGDPVADPQPAPEPPPPTLAVTRIVAFGDSITEGVVSPALTTSLFVEVAQSYPTKLRGLMAARYRSQAITVLNAGRAGERAADATARFADAVKEGQPEVVLLMHGANDLVALGRRGVSPAIGGIETMIKEATRRGAQVFLATLPPQREGSPKGVATSLVAEYNRELVKAAAEEGARLIDMNAALSLSDVGADGLHPTEDGYQKIAGVFQSALATVFERAPATASAARR